MHKRQATLTDFLARQCDDMAGESGSRSGLVLLIGEIARAIGAISALVSKSAFGTHGDGYSQLDARARDIFVNMCEQSPHVAGFLGAGLDHAQATIRHAATATTLHAAHATPRHAVQATSHDAAQAKSLVVFDALDDIGYAGRNVTTGTIFSVGARRASQPVTDAAFLRAGCEQVAAGYAIYGPSTMLVLTVGAGTHGFTLERETGDFVLTQPSIRMPAHTTRVSVDNATERFWEPPVLRYVRECRAGSAGDREQDFAMRWTGSTLTDIHDVLMQGGVCILPRERRQAARAGRLRLLHEANPLALLLEQAGGRASTGSARILELEPTTLDERVAAMLGSCGEVERLERYHRECERGMDEPFVSPLFNERSLFRPEARV
jgi:fructose-1,6-bisphosphatase I / sedoheptulose-1,7-bisphosphatase